MATTPSDNLDRVSRRTFLKAGATTAAAASLPLIALGEEPPVAPKEALPRRPLGRTGEQVTILNLGTAQGSANPRMLNAAYDAGVRYLDTADCYAGGRSEKSVGQWIKDTGRRKEFFIVTKDHPKNPDHWVEQVDRRLEALQTDSIDLFFIHNLAEDYQGMPPTEARDIPHAKEWAAAAKKMKEAGKIRFAGFSTHTEVPVRTRLLNSAAAKGTWVDAIMLAYDPKTVREDAEFNKALDACHKAGVGLVCMKEMRSVAHAPKLFPEFESKGLTAHQAVLHAVWSDERIASICSAMSSFAILKENTTAAREFKPLDEKTAGAVIDFYKTYAQGYCNACDGRCRRAAGTNAALGTIARALSYCECDGAHEHGRAVYAALTPEERDWHGADLNAASAACVSNLDFATLLPRAEEKLA